MMDIRTSQKHWYRSHFSLTPLSDRIIMLCPSETALKVACTHFSKARSSPFLFSILYRVEIVAALKSG
jgi:hypothetical protein